VLTNTPGDLNSIEKVYDLLDCLLSLIYIATQGFLEAPQHTLEVVEQNGMINQVV
jgi:hypothetical protein